jgi:hypothetical protein
MPNLRKMLRTRDDHYVLSPTPSFKPDLTSSWHENEDVSMQMYEGRRQYTLEVRVFTKFACNEEAREHAEENAYRQIQRMVYSNMEELLYEVKSAIYAGQEEQAIKALNAALDECRGRG